MKDKTQMWAIISLFLILILTLLTILATGVWLKPANAWEPTYSHLDIGIMGWELGDDIVPYAASLPFFGYDCDDVAIYSRYWLLSLDEDLNVEIYRSIRVNPVTRLFHVWLVVDNVTDSYIYDWGFARQDTWNFEGRRMTFKQLLQEAIWDEQ